ncbi:hypothetical protein K504DRAFT_382197, partial [Pleomassaria siparia CBS 279.74]
INQSDLLEKSPTVQSVQRTYFGASQVIVWLGKGSRTRSPAFELVTSFTLANDADKRSVWKTVRFSG